MTEEAVADLTADTLALMRIEGAYAPTYDGRHGKEWANLFTEEGIYQARVVDGQAGNFIAGRENLARFCDEQPWHGIHYMMIPTFDIDGDTASCRVHFQYRAIGIVDGRVSIRNSSGAYDVAYVRTGAGWRIARRVTSFFAESREVFHGWYPTAADMSERWPYQNERYVDRRV
ncbi:nuclear transport factor 2 family protein [Plantactinospora sp. WMMC1484]|uniref:nuclear transport factor 2 family protein n=1 Tax=Plantactinospora sp. WMMC1484 TaxID=3404122 RepID=UPI003BF505EF